MRKELDDILCQKYPKIFADRGLDIKESCMGWGFSCKDGWFDLIDSLCGSLQLMADRGGAPQVVAKQVKEKFGTLRFYYSGGDEVTSGMVIMAQALSARICEVCGAPGALEDNDGWYRVRCKVHAVRRRNHDATKDGISFNSETQDAVSESKDDKKSCLYVRDDLNMENPFGLSDVYFHIKGKRYNEIYFFIDAYTMIRVRADGSVDVEGELYPENVYSCEINSLSNDEVVGVVKALLVASEFAQEKGLGCVNDGWVNFNLSVKGRSA